MPARVYKHARLSEWRVNLFAVLIVAIVGGIFFRLFDLTYIRHTEFVRSSQFQYNNPAAIISGRGDIYASDYSNNSRHLVATNKSFWYVYTNTKLIVSPQDVANQLALILSKPSEQILGQLTGGNTYQVLADHLDKATGDKINKLNLKGITAASEIDRFYTNGSFLADTLGFVGFDGNRRSGQYGLEAYYDDTLSGVTKTQSFSGNKTYSAVVNIFRFLTGQSTANTSTTNDGSDLVLTVDYNIQAFVETKLSATLKKWNAEGGSVIVEDPKTGAILAMASSPSFNPNYYSNADLKNLLNKNVQQLFEPGSSFKPVTMSGAIDTGSVTPDTTYNDTGVVQFGTYAIKNFNEKANGIQTMRQVLEHSLNTGAMFAENKMGDDAFINYVVGFGFGQKTGIDMPGEIDGNISNLYSGRKINFATAAFGQGIAVTPIQLVNAYSAMANNGWLMRPYLVKEVIKTDGTKVVTQPKVLGTPITEKTSLTIKSMLADVVAKGFDKAHITGYDLAGKTGTAQIPNPNGAGYLDNNQFIHDFMGFAPAYAPRFVVLIKMDKPKGIKFAADSLSPVYGDIARFLIRYFNIPPNK